METIVVCKQYFYTTAGKHCGAELDISSFSYPNPI